MPGNQQQDDNERLLGNLDRELRGLIKSDEPLRPRFPFGPYRVVIKTGELGYVLKDGVFDRQLEPGIWEWGWDFGHNYRMARITTIISDFQFPVNVTITGSIFRDHEMPSYETILILQVTRRVANLKNLLDIERPITGLAATIRDYILRNINKRNDDGQRLYPYSAAAEWVGPLIDAMRDQYLQTVAVERVGLSVPVINLLEVMGKPPEDAILREALELDKEAEHILSHARAIAGAGIIDADAIRQEADKLGMRASVLAILREPNGKHLIDQQATLSNLRELAQILGVPLASRVSELPSFPFSGVFVPEREPIGNRINVEIESLKASAPNASVNVYPLTPLDDGHGRLSAAYTITLTPGWGSIEMQLPVGFPDNPPVIHVNRGGSVQRTDVTGWTAEQRLADVIRNILSNQGV